jgi:hypothetical protein
VDLEKEKEEKVHDRTLQSSDLRLRSIIAMEAVTGRERGGAPGRSDLTLAVHLVIARREEEGQLHDRTLNSVYDWTRRGCVKSSLTSLPCVRLELT